VEIKDLLGFSKPLTRLIEVVSAGIGRVYAPTLIRRTADAEAYKTKVLAAAVAEASKSADQPVAYENGVLVTWRKPDDGTFVVLPSTTEERALARLDYQQRRQQSNIETIVGAAAENLAEVAEVPLQAPDEDWIGRFFAYAQDVNSAQFQQVWSRILAGEIKRPGTFSLRALEALRHLSKSDAEVFEKMLSASVYTLDLSGVRSYLVPVHDEQRLENAFEIYKFHHITLSEIGLMYPDEIFLNSFMSDDIKSRVLVAEPNYLVATRGSIKSPVAFKVWKFSATGSELARLVQSHVDLTVLRDIGSLFIKCGADVTLYEIASYKDGNPDAGKEIEDIK
jgi:uncharacterized repeat protein (TIGR03899 family)